MRYVIWSNRQFPEYGVAEFGVDFDVPFADIFGGIIGPYGIQFHRSIMAGKPPCGRESRMSKRGGRKHGPLLRLVMCVHIMSTPFERVSSLEGSHPRAQIMTQLDGLGKMDAIYYRKIVEPVRRPSRLAVRFSTSKNRLLYCPSRELRIHERCGRQAHHQIVT